MCSVQMTEPQRTQTNVYFLMFVQMVVQAIFIFYARFVMLLKGIGESFILSEDEPLTPNIDGDMAL